MELMEQQREEAAPVAEPDSPAAEGTPSESIDTSVDDLIREFEEATARPPEPATDNVDGVTQAQDSELDALLRELDGGSADRQKIEQLTSQVDSFRAAEFQRAEREAAEHWASELQAHVSRMNPNIP